MEEVGFDDLLVHIELLVSSHLSPLSPTLVRLLRAVEVVVETHLQLDLISHLPLPIPLVSRSVVNLLLVPVSFDRRPLLHVHLLLPVTRINLQLESFTVSTSPRPLQHVHRVPLVHHPHRIIPLVVGERGVFRS